MADLQDRIDGDDRDVVIVEETAVVPADPPRSQYIKFGILAVIMLVTIIVVGLAAPIITGRIVDAILGDFGAGKVDTAVPTNTEVEDTTAPSVEEPGLEETGVGGGETAGEEPTAAEESSEPATTESSTPEAPAEPVAVQTHQVQPGDTLFAISRQYNVSVNAIAQANNLTNVNNLPVGLTLIIPPAEE